MGPAGEQFPEQRTTPQPAGDSVHLEAHASGEARINQAARDFHLHYQDRVRGTRRVIPGTGAQDCPYPGLASFGYEQARWFFGRDELTAELTARLDTRLRTGGVQVVVAPSGAGKSSLLQAGLLPQLETSALPGSHRWPRMVFTPTAYPLAALATQIAALTGTNPATLAQQLAADSQPAEAVLRQALRARMGEEDSGTRIVVIVDQFEELFTLCTDDRHRRTFIELLSQLASPRLDRDADPQSGGLVVVSLRSDFYATCANNSHLRTALQDNPLVVGPMSDTELREAIRYPAQDVGLDVEPGLVELLLRDLGDTTTTTGESRVTSYAAGRLPLLAHALRATWQQRHGHALTVEGYRSTGGIHRAVAITADRVFTGLDSAGQHAARTLFLRLIKIGDDSEDTRRRVSRADLLRGLDPGSAEPVVDAFTQGRLLTQEQDTVEITHEALLRAWPRLRQWIDTDRAGNLIRQELEEAVAIWIRDGRDAAGLYRGSRLKAARTWATSRSQDGDVSPTVSEFLARSTRQEHRFHQTRLLAAGLAVVLLIVSVLSVVTYHESNEAQKQRLEAQKQRLLSAAAELRYENPAESLRKAAEAYQTSNDADTREAVLIAASAAPRGQVIAGRPGEPKVAGMAVTPDQRQVVTYDAQGGIGLIDDEGRLTKTAKASHLTGVFAAATSPNASQVALATDHGSAAVLDIATGRQVDLATDRSPIATIWWIQPPSDDLVLLQTTSGVVATYSATTGQQVAHWATPVYEAKPTADGQIVTSDRDYRLRVWNPRTGAQVAESSPLAQPTRKLQPSTHEAIGVTNDNNLITWTWGGPSPEQSQHPLTNVTTSTLVRTNERTHRVAIVADKAVRIYRLDNGALQGSLPQQPSWLRDVQWSPEGQWIATAGNDGVRVWSANGTGTPSRATYEFIVPGGVRRVTFVRDGTSLILLGLDGTVSRWDLPQIQRFDLTDWRLSANVSNVSTDVRWLAAASVDGTVRILDLAGASTVPVATIPVGDPVRPARAVKFDPTDSHHILTLQWPGATPRAWRWGSDHGAEPLPTFQIPPSLSRSVDSTYLTSLDISQDGTLVAAEDYGGNVYLWDAHTGRIVRDPVLTGSGYSASSDMLYVSAGVAFDRSGQLLAAASPKGIRVIELATRKERELLSLPGATYVAFDQSGKYLVGVAGDRGVLRIWTRDDQPVHEPVAAGGTMGGPSFSRDGRLVAVGTGEGRIQVWDVLSGRTVLFTRQHSALVNDVRFLPGSPSRLVSTSDDSTVAISECLACDDRDAVIQDAERWVANNPR